MFQRPYTETDSTLCPGWYNNVNRGAPRWNSQLVACVKFIIALLNSRFIHPKIKKVLYLAIVLSVIWNICRTYVGHGTPSFAGKYIPGTK